MKFYEQTVEKYYGGTKNYYWIYYIWHHNAQSAPNKMQLVLLAVHDAVRHTGQNALKQGR
ncbi:HNH endonuclease [Kingella denitrificans]